MAGEPTKGDPSGANFAETATIAADGAAQGNALPMLSGVAPGAKLGSYQLTRELGRGAMGAVYEGVHATLGRRAAIKVLLPNAGSSKELLARFLREGQAASRIRHPNVVDVYDVGVEGEVPFLVMELLEGEDFCDLLSRESKLGAERTADLMVPVLCALAAAHELGIVHRDLKPSNIFLARGGDLEITPKIVDFGISKMVDETRAAGLTATSSLLGTPYYMSPEQAASAKHIDARTDQFAAAVILYEAMSGKRPFEGASMLALLTQIHSASHAPLGEVAPDLPQEIVDAVERAMARRPEERFSSTLELARALLPFAGERVRVLYAKQIEGMGEVTARAVQRENDVPSLSGAARTANEALEEDRGTGAGKMLLYGTVSFVALCVALGAWAAYALSTREAPQPPSNNVSASSVAPPAQVVASSSASVALATRGPMVHTCSTDKCDEGVAWCDARETRVACCAQGLVVRSLDGVCGCPPGGTTREELVGQGCKRAEAASATELRTVIEVARPEVRRCYQTGLADASFEGKVELKLVLTPDGDVFDARVVSSSVVDADVQRCVLKHTRGLRFPPPANGIAIIKYPMMLKLEDER